jgi:hypothetical protein
MKRILKTINPKTEIKLPFQKEFAFFNSMNSKETKKNFSTDNPIIKAIATLETAITFEIKAVVIVNIINKP